MIAAPARAAAPPKATVNTAAGLNKPVIFTSGLGGVAGWCVVHPFNTVAIRMNYVDGERGERRGAKGFIVRQRAHQQGGRRLAYAGLSALLPQIFYRRSDWPLRDHARASSKYTSRTCALIGASVAGGARLVVPVEVPRPHVQRRVSGGAATATRSVFDAMARIMSEEGPAAFCR